MSLLKVPKGDPALELIQELLSLEASGAALCPFDDRRMQAVAAMTRDLDDDLQAHMHNPHVDPRDPYFLAYPVMLREKMRRNKRAMVTYMGWRLNSLTALWWQNRDHEVTSTEHTTAAERNFLRQYNELLTDYMGCSLLPADNNNNNNDDDMMMMTTSAMNLDLRSFITRPPGFPPSGVVEVIGLKPFTFVSPVTMATVSVYRGQVSSIPVEDAESLVLQGVAKYTSSSQ